MTVALGDRWLGWVGRLVGRLSVWAMDRRPARGAAPAAVEGLESAVGGALPRMPMPYEFRRSLAESLSLAAQSRARDLSVSRNRLVRPEWVLALSAGLLAATAVAMALALSKRTGERG